MIIKNNNNNNNNSNNKNKNKIIIIIIQFIINKNSPKVFLRKLAASANTLRASKASTANIITISDAFTRRVTEGYTFG